MANRLLKNSLSAVPRVLAASAVAVPYTALTAETVLATIPIAAGVMGANGILRVSFKVSFSADTINKEIRIKLGGTGTNGTLMCHLFNNTAANIGFTETFLIQNANATNAQKGDAEFVNGSGYSSFAVLTGTVDTTAAQNIYINAAQNTSTGTITLVSYMVELIPLA